MPKVATFPSAEPVKPVQPPADQKALKEAISEYLKVFGYDKILSEPETRQFIQTALAGNLDPFKREIYIAVYGEGANRKVSVLTGYQVYLKRAERTGSLDGWRARIEGSGDQMKAVVEIFRKDWSHSFTHEVYWEEAVQKKKDGFPTQFWSKQPRFQLRKVAIAQAFRLAFPDELGGLPYESAELPDSENTAANAATALPAGYVKTPAPGSKDSRAEEALADAPVNPETAKTPAGGEPAGGLDSGTEDDFLEAAVRRVETLFETRPDDFTEKHQAWILDKIYKAPGRAGIQKMLAYTEKVVKQSA
jgi:phage recombination protein Bet